LIRIGLLTSQDKSREGDENPLYKKYFMHGISHHLGLDVHDLGDKHRVFEEGMVLTCEPGIYVREEKTGVRIENDILITEQGPIDLTRKIPSDPEEIEDLMNS